MAHSIPSETSANKRLIAGTAAEARERMRLLVAIEEPVRRLFLGGMEARLEQLAAEVLVPADTVAIDGELLEEFEPDIILTGWSSPCLPLQWLRKPHCPLRYVCHLMGAVRFLVPREFIERGGIVSNWGALAAPSVAEHALLLALAALRNSRNWERAIHSAEPVFTPTYLGTRSLFGRRVGIHGFGAVARSLLKLLRPFGVDIRVFTEGIASADYAAEGVVRSKSLHELFSHSEILFECEGLTPLNEGVVDAGALACLPDGAVFINVGRGGLVDEQALLREADSGRIRLALDVVRAEPLTPSNPLYAVKDAVFSPHIAGPTEDIYPDVGRFALDNIERFLQGREPLSCVTLEVYDRTT